MYIFCFGLIDPPWKKKNIVSRYTTRCQVVKKRLRSRIEFLINYCFDSLIASLIDEIFGSSSNCVISSLSPVQLQRDISIWRDKGGLVFFLNIDVNSLCTCVCFYLVYIYIHYCWSLYYIAMHRYTYFQKPDRKLIQETIMKQIFLFAILWLQFNDFNTYCYKIFNKHIMLCITDQLNDVSWWQHSI